ncbi:uncharacterized protein [Littorina saxatilis]|uniref:uncharacterized protein n=1 Tax=Littorina saxatilis TaxID=31220 RepID=UPI0038B59087
MLQVLEQGESVQQDLPDLPSVDLLNTRFHPRPFVPLYSLVAPPLNNEQTAIGIGTGAAVIADQGTHQPALDAASVPVCQAAVIADQGTHQPALDVTSVPVCNAASTRDFSTVNAAVTNFIAGTTTTEPRQHALPVVDLVVGVNASTSAATTNNATYEAYGPQRREDVNAPHHVGTSAPFVHQEPFTNAPHHVGTSAPFVRQEPFTPNYTTAATTSSMRPTALLTTLQHPLGAYTGQPPLHNVGHSTTSVTGSRPPDLDHTGWSYHLPETREGDETQERHTYFPEERHQRMDHRRFQVAPPCFPYDTHLHPKPEPFVPTFLDPHQTTPKVIWGNENARPPAYMNFDKECHADRPFASYPPSAYYQRPLATPAKQDTPMDSLAKTLSDALMINRLPMQEPCIFVGDPLQYPIWRSSFSFLIERQNITSSEKLLYLQRYIGGQAKEAVTGFFLLREGDAYERAMEVLENRFGNSYVVSQAFRTKLDEWTPVKSKDPKGLRSLADFLQQCSVAAQEVGGLSILDDAQYLRKIVGKLPDWMSHRWSRTVARTKVEKKRYPLFHELVSFVTLEADISNDPVFGLTSASGTPRKFTTNLSTLTEDVSACLHCQLPDHDAGTCKELIEKPLVEIRDFLFKNRICYGCLRSKDHQSRQCMQRQTCKKCKKAHPTCLHDDNFKYQNSMSETKGASEHKNNYRTSAADVQEPLSSSTPTVSALKASEENSIGFTSMIVPVLVSSDSNPNVEVLTYALLDTMSNATFVVQSVAEEVKAKSQPTTLRVSTLTEDNAMVSGRKYSGLRVRSPTSSEFVRLPSAISRPYLSVDPTQIPTSETVKVYPHLQHLSPKLPPLYPDCEAGLLIGYDCAEALMPLNVVQGLPFAVETKLGWSIVGKSPHSVAFDGVGSSMHVVVKPGSRQEESAAHVYKIQVDEVSCTDLLHVMERDFADSDTGSMSQDDLKFMKIVKENVKVNEAGHYEMPLPFRPEQPSLPDNRGAAVKRLMGLKRQFEKKPGYREDYIKFMNVILERGDAELIPKNEVEVPNRWYIPHHGVYNDKKPGKIRVVFDCSARHLGTSLNDLLLQGPDLISSLSGVLCRFRKGPIAFSCDVEKMYHQFHVSEPHRDFLRFLWWKDGDTSGQPLDYRMKVHIFGATSSPGCANFGLKQVAKDNATISAKASAFLQRDFYVDDGLQAKDSVEEAADVLMKAREICEHGQLRLHKIVSNSKELLEYFPDSEVTSTKATELAVPCSTPEIERTLGLHWCTDDDTLGFTDNPRLGPSNRRGVLSTIASVYDPLGFLAPFLLTGKLILQELCRQELGWDDPLPPSLQERWEEWLKDLSRLGCVKVPRNYLPTDFGTVKNVELHHFSDASTAGYGQCSYLRFENHLGNIHSTLVVAKARVAPLRHVTVPRLELTAAVLSVKMARFLQEELDFESIEHFFWTDSMIVLAYLKNESKRFHVFVANRVQQIRQFSQASQWNHVSTKENPADYASRGLSVSDLMTSEWFHGPAFLSQSLPESDDFFEIPDDDVEVKVCKATTSKEVSVQSFEQIAQRFSSKTSLIRAMAVLVRKCNAIKGHQSSPLEVLEVTEKKFIVCLQKEHFERPTPSLRNQLQALNAHKDTDGILRVYGRSQNSSSSSADKFPILLPRDSHFSLLVVQDCHAAIAHQGRMFTINQVRASGFWIIGIRHVVSSLVRRCVHCRWHRSGPAGQKMADLPPERIDPSPPFTYCGIDCFGPFHVKDGRREVKRYGLIVTCFASRAIHIETLDDMSSDSFINALRIVVSMRGNISRIWCDKGTNFVGACNEFKLAWKEMDSERLTSKMLESKCEFKFNPPAASHMGGVWERQIRTIRSILNGLLRRSGQRLTTSSLRTFLYEVMAIVNSRPLSVESLESADGPRPLTPNHVLTMKSGAILPPPGVFEDPDLYARKRWRCVQRMADEFWLLWKSQYLSLLQKRRVWQRPQANVQVGDVVVLHDQNLCRSEWCMARVIEVMPGSDGLVRRVKVHVGTKALDNHGRPTGDSRILERPIHKMTVLVDRENHEDKAV